VVVSKVDGRNKKHRVFIYALSTCVWCKRTKQFLKEKSVEYEYVDVDLVNGDERRRIEKEFAKTGSYSYPTLVIDGKRVIKGYRVDEIKEALGI
jgi:glutaredoxin-like protein NrdH